MKRLISHVASLLVALLLTACATTDTSRRSATALAPHEKPPFEVALQDHLRRLERVEEATPSAVPSGTALADFDAAVAREQEILAALRAQHDAGEPFSPTLLEELKSAIPDAQFDAIYRELIDDPTAPMPDRMVARIGGAR